MKPHARLRQEIPSNLGLIQAWLDNEINSNLGLIQAWLDNEINSNLTTLHGTKDMLIRRIRWGRRRHDFHH
jgi:sensor domain CHASE-containing protein